MPHKHTRKYDGNEKNFDLAPGIVAKPLAAFEKSTKLKKGGKPVAKGGNGPAKDLKRKRTAKNADDTPRAFARLMQLQAGVKQRSGLDNGEPRRAKKTKLELEGRPRAPPPPAAESTTPASDALKIMPGERMADFAARVDQALPMGNLTRKGQVKIDGIKEKQTRTEKRLHKMYAEWREVDAKRKEKEEEFREQQEELADEEDAEAGNESASFPESRRKKRKRLVGEVASDDDDPWAVLKERREKPKGLHDVVQAPPTLKVVPKEKFKVRNGAKVNVANVPANAGSLARREELSDARREVIERYRSMMKGPK